MGRNPLSLRKSPIKDLRRRSLQSDMRQLTGHEKAVVLRQQIDCTRAQAAKVCSISCSALVRAETACKRGRSVGVKGRPTLLSKSQEDTLVEMIQQDCQAGDPPDCADLCEMVWLYLCTPKETRTLLTLFVLLIATGIQPDRG